MPAVEPLGIALVLVIAALLEGVHRLRARRARVPAGIAPGWVAELEEVAAPSTARR